MNESPVNYNMWSAISVISAVLKNNVWIDMGNYKLYPNQYIVLVGPPGVGKGSAIKPAHNFSKDPSVKSSLANYIEDRITAAKLIETLTNGFPCAPHFTSNGSLVNGKDSTCILQAEELSTLLNGNDWISDFLTKTWEGGEFVYATKSGSKQLAKGLCPSLIGACPANFIKAINKSNGAPISNGFTARTIFVNGPEPSKAIPFKKGFKDFPQLSTDLDADLLAISRLGGEYVFNAISRDMYETKYYEIRKDNTEADSDVIKNFKSRQPTHILKVAMAFAAAKSDDMVLNENSMLSAIQLVDEVLVMLDDIFSGVGDSDLVEGIDRIHKYMMKRGTATRSELIRDNRRNITPDHLDAVLYVLEESSILRSYNQGGKKTYDFITGGKP